MKILMFGWEFPPHISGGLGTACYGLTKALSSLNETEITFVVPKAFGDEISTGIKLIGANTVPFSKKKISFTDIQKKIEYYEVFSNLIPYTNEDEYWHLKKQKTKPKARFIKTSDGYTIDFTGHYGPSLIDEIKNYAAIAEIIAVNNHFDIIHAHDWLAYPAGIAAKKATGKPLVVHVHATEFDRSGNNINPVVYAVEREGMDAADKIITVSKFTKQILIEKYLINPQKITTVYNAVENAFTGRKFQFKKGVTDKIVTFLGRITSQKGPEYFIEAAYLVLKKMKNVRFVMAGSGDKLNDMITSTARLGIADKFHFTGFLRDHDVSRLFQMTDVLVMPSVSEPFGIVTLEAMQSNVPVIISSRSGVSEIINNAIKIDFWDTYVMANAIYGLLHYHSLADFLKKSGKKEVEKITWKQSAMKVRAVYNKVLAHKQ